jgi:hypothetical protein
MLALKRNFSPSVQASSELKKYNKCANIKVWKIAELRWNEVVKEEFKIVRTLFSPRNQSDVNYAYRGPKYYLTRPELTPYERTNRLVGKIDRGLDSKIIIFNNETKVDRPVVLSSDGHAVAPRSDGGVWLISANKILQYDLYGNLKRLVTNPGGTRLISVNDNGAWILSLTHAWFLDSNGTVQGSWLWNGFHNSIGINKSLCRLEGKSIRCLEPNGKESFSQFDWMQSTPRGSLLFLSTDTILVGDRYQLYRYEKNGTDDKLVLYNAGLTAQGEAFVSIQSDDNWSDVCISNGTSRRILSSYDNPSFKSPTHPGLQVVAVDEDRTLVYAFDKAIWYKGSKLESSFLVNEEIYRSKILPYSWLMPISQNSISVRALDETIVVSSSGSTGIAIIGLKWE